MGVEKQDNGPDLLVHWAEQPASSQLISRSLASLAINTLVLGCMIAIARIPGAPYRMPPNRVDERRVVHLVVPRELTQRDPNPAKPAKEVSVESLQARPEVKPRPARPARVFRAPRQVAAAAPPPALDPPKIDIPVPLGPQIGVPQAPPPPKTAPAEQPKIALEMPGQNGTQIRAPGQVRIPTPKTSVEEAVREATRMPGQSGVSVGDQEQPLSLAEQLHQPQTPGKVQSSLQLLSDPLGVDFKPYLIRILATVRRNWLAIIPESARMGRQGKVLLQFIVARNGSVPKLVIAMPSGAEALDRAAVAGISASVPFPPLPSEFKGAEVRLQFAFSYNTR